MDWFFSVIGQVSLTISDYGTASGRVPHQFTCRPHLFVICCNYPVVFKPSIVNCSSPVCLLTSGSTGHLGFLCSVSFMFYLPVLSCISIGTLILIHPHTYYLGLADNKVHWFWVWLFVSVSASGCIRVSQGYLATDWRSPGSSHQPSD